jgi:toxin YoeB
LVTEWQVIFTKYARKDAQRLASSNLRAKAEQLLEILASDPFHKPPPFEKLVGDLAGAYSRRINIQHRLVYQVLEKQRTVKVLRMWTHYEQ